MKKIQLTTFTILILGAVISSFAQTTFIKYMDHSGQLYPLDITEDMFANMDPDVMGFKNTETCDFFIHIFEKMHQDSVNQNQIPSSPNVCRQILVYQSGSPIYCLSYDRYHMILNGKPVEYNSFLYNLIEKVIELDQYSEHIDGGTYIHESIVDYHLKKRYPIIETLIQEQLSDRISKNDCQFDISLGHSVLGRIGIVATALYDTSQNEMPAIVTFQIENIDTSFEVGNRIRHYSRIYPMYSGAQEISMEDYLILADKYFFSTTASYFSQGENTYKVSISSPSVEIRPSMLNMIAGQLEDLIPPSLFIIPDYGNISLPQPNQIEFHLTLPCQLK